MTSPECGREIREPFTRNVIEVVIRLGMESAGLPGEVDFGNYALWDEEFKLDRLIFPVSS